jgi:hypothetical protein
MSDLNRTSIPAVLLAIGAGLVPVASQAQTVTASQLSFTSSDCTGGKTLQVTYSYQGAACGSGQAAACPPTTDAYLQIFATQAACPAPNASSNTEVTLPSDAIDIVSYREYDAATDDAEESTSIPVAELAGNNCSAQANYTWNICMYDYYEPTPGVYATSSASPVGPVVYSAKPVSGTSTGAGTSTGSGGSGGEQNSGCVQAPGSVTGVGCAFTLLTLLARKRKASS